jgi:hypothetical protein
MPDRLPNASTSRFYELLTWTRFRNAGGLRFMPRLLG